MNEKKGSTILLTVIGIATLLVTLVGATYAYFTAQINNNNADKTDVTITAAKLANINFVHGNEINLANALPGATQEIDFTVSKAEATTVDTDYKVYFVVTANDFVTENLVATLTSSAGTSTSVFSTQKSLKPYTTAGATGGKYEVGTGTLAAGETLDTDKWTLKVDLLETGAPQNDDQSKTFTAKIVVELADSTTYTQQDVYPTTAQ